MTEKMELVEENLGIYGLNQILSALGLSKGTYYYRCHHEPVRQARDAALDYRVPYEVVLEAIDGEDGRR